MATKYLDHGLYPAWSAAPTFGTCQDGDGTAQGAGTVATCSIDLSAYTAAAGNTVTIAGAVLTCVASGAGANQFNAGGNSTLAANLASAINAATNAVVTAGASNPMLGWPTTTRLSDLIYATASGAVLNIQTRMGSAAFNASSFFAVVSSGLTGGTLNSQFSGGAGGAWGYLFNLASFGKAPIGISGYGCWTATKPFAGSMDPGDLIKVRAKTITLAANQSGGITFPAMGSASQPVVFDIDDGTTWTADAPNPYLKIVGTWVGNINYGFLCSTGTNAHIKGKRYNVANDSLKRNLILESNGTGSSSAGFYIQAGNSPMTWENVLLDTPNLPNATAFPQIRYTSGAGASIKTRFVGCRQVWSGPNSAIGGFIYNGGTNGIGYMSVDAHEFVLNSSNTPMSSIIAPLSGGGAMILRITDAKFVGFTTGSTLLGGSANPGAGSEVLFKNCDYGNISVRGPYLCTATTTAISSEMYASESKYGQRDFFLDRRNGFCEWNSAKGLPTASARLLDNATPWSIFATSSVYATNVSKASPFELPAINKINTLATGDRTVTMNFAVESGLNWNRGDISFMVTYQDSTGAIRYVDSYDPLGATAFAADTTSVWTFEQNGDISFNSLVYKKKQISLSCPDIPLGAEISIFIRIHTPVDATTKGILIDPELKVS